MAPWGACGPWALVLALPLPSGTSHTPPASQLVQQDWRHLLRWCPVAATACQERHSSGAKAELFAYGKVRADPTTLG